jgi:DNA-binding transcriptional ArsR family regulator
MTSSEVARWLGVSVPSIHRAVARLGLSPLRLERGLRFSLAEVQALTRSLGAVPTVPGWRRHDVQVLAALSQAPLGLRSARAVARRAGVSPTSASHSLADLRAAGLVTLDHGVFAEGRAVAGTLWKLQFGDPRWVALAPVVAKAVLPTPPSWPSDQRVPRRLYHHFWNADVSRLNGPEADGYVTTRLLLSGDPQATAWVAAHGTRHGLAAAGRNRGASRADRQLVHNLAAAR